MRFKVEIIDSNSAVDFTISYKEDFPRFAKIDQIRLSQVIINILKNALKFTEKGTVRLECDLVNSTDLLFTIRDTNQEVKIITLTAMNADTSIIHECLLVGINDFITKPFEIENFAEVINN